MKYAMYQTISRKQRFMRDIVQDVQKHHLVLVGNSLICQKYWRPWSFIQYAIWGGISRLAN